MKRFFILPYRQGSASARALALALGGRVLRLHGSTATIRGDDVVINWGNTDPEQVGRATLNAVDLRGATNKKSFFLLMKEKGHEKIIPRFWCDSASIPDDAFPVFCRTLLAGHSGDGIVVAETRGDLVGCGLYVSYVKKESEYRIHVGRRGSEIVVISVQRKARRLDTPDNAVNWRIRNLKNGFIYTRQDVTPPAGVIEVAKTALDVSGLDFGAVDVVYNTGGKRAYVLEINTAPGLEGQTVEDYANFFMGRAP